MDDVTEPSHDELDDGFPYEHLGSEAMTWASVGWCTPTAFQLVALKELLAKVVSIYGRHGHWLVRDIGADNLRNPRFVEGIGLSMYEKLYATALSALPEHERDGFDGTNIQTFSRNRSS